MLQVMMICNLVTCLPIVLVSLYCISFIYCKLSWHCCLANLGLSQLKSLCAPFFRFSVNIIPSRITSPFDVQDKQEVVIEKIVRNKRKCVTVVKGLELFGEWFSVKIKYVRS
jgi:hypothetical protein